MTVGRPDIDFTIDFCPLNGMDRLTPIEERTLQFKHDFTIEFCTLTCMNRLTPIDGRAQISNWRLF